MLPIEPKRFAAIAGIPEVLEDFDLSICRKWARNYRSGNYLAMLSIWAGLGAPRACSGAHAQRAETAGDTE
jgi:hypothetical protein